MSKLRYWITMSLDGYVAGPDQSEQNPLGVGGMELHTWAFPLAAFRELHGEEGGEENASGPVVRKRFENLGATIMGRNMFGGHGSWEEHPWDGWWGADPPFHTPVFVVTHRPEEDPGTGEFTFVDGFDEAIRRAREVAGDKDVAIGGGADVIRQGLAAGVVDELAIIIAPVVLGGGKALFDGFTTALDLEPIGVREMEWATLIEYRVTGRGAPG